MKQLIVVRHAKSSWKEEVDDHQRPLNARGMSDAHLMSNHLKHHFVMPDLVLSSDAVRAKTTAGVFVENLNIPESIFSLEPKLYDFSGNSLLKVVKSTPDKVDRLMVFGHNFALTHFVNTYGDLQIVNVPTCGFVEISFNIASWDALKKGKTIKTLFPKQLK